MTESDWAYLAGLIDGEGDISFSHTVRVRISNTDGGIIGWLTGHFPESKISKANSNSSYGKKLCLKIAWNGVKAKPILQNVLPHLQGKKHRLAKLGLELISIIETNYYRFTPEIIESKEKIRAEASIINSQ